MCILPFTFSRKPCNHISITKFVLLFRFADNVLNFIRSHPLMDEAVSHDTGKPIFYMQDLTFTHLVVEQVPIPLTRQNGDTDYYSIYFVGSRTLTSLVFPIFGISSIVTYQITVSIKSLLP